MKREDWSGTFTSEGMPERTRSYERVMETIPSIGPSEEARPGDILILDFWS